MWTEGAFYSLLGFSQIRVAILSIDDRNLDIGLLHNKILMYVNLRGPHLTPSTLETK